MMEVAEKGHERLREMLIIIIVHPLDESWFRLKKYFYPALPVFKLYLSTNKGAHK